MIITTWWPNRCLIYVMLIIAWLITWLKQGVLAFSFDSILLFLGLTFFFEIYGFGFRIEIIDEKMTYWRWPKYLSKGKLIQRNDIKNVQHLPLSYGRKIKVAIFDIYLKKSDKPVRISLAAFSPKDIKMIFKWLGYKP